MDVLLEGRITVDSNGTVYVRIHVGDTSHSGRAVVAISSDGYTVVLHERYSSMAQEALELMEPKPLPTKPGTVIHDVKRKFGAHRAAILDDEGNWLVPTQGGSLMYVQASTILDWEEV